MRKEKALSQWHRHSRTLRTRGFRAIIRLRQSFSPRHSARRSRKCEAWGQDGKALTEGVKRRHRLDLSAPKASVAGLRWHALRTPYDPLRSKLAFTASGEIACQAVFDKS